MNIEPLPVKLTNNHMDDRLFLCSVLPGSAETQLRSSYIFCISIRVSNLTEITKIDQEMQEL